VARWLLSAGFDREPRDEQLAQVTLLATFCSWRGSTPAELVQSCLTAATDDGQFEINIKGRRAMNRAIDEFSGTLGLPRHQAIAAGNVIRGFLVHNGVLIQGVPSIP